MGSKCRWCQKDILDDERLTDPLGVSVEFHRACINIMQDLAIAGAQRWTHRDMG